LVESSELLDAALRFLEQAAVLLGVSVDGGGEAECSGSHDVIEVGSKADDGGCSFGGDREGLVFFRKVDTGKERSSGMRRSHFDLRNGGVGWCGGRGDALQDVAGALIGEIEGGVGHLVVGGAAVVFTEPTVLAMVLVSNVSVYGAVEHLGILIG
jgi:hypothetical protein